MLDLLETASRSYLGQTFSDGASSPESLTSEPISFATPKAGAVTVSTVEHRNSTHFTTPTQYQATTSSTRQFEAPARTSYPKEVPGVKVTSSTRAVSVSPKKRTHSPQRSRHAPPQRGQMRHAASFDCGQSGIGLSSNVTGSLLFSHDSQSFDNGNGIVRKLFSQTVSDPCSSNTPHRNVESNLSHSVNIQSSGNSVGSLPLTAISLDEVEKQMTAEVASPDSNIPFSLLNSTTTTTNSIAPLSQSTPSEQAQRNVLSQPSIFNPGPVSQTQSLSISVKPPTPITVHNFSQATANVLLTPRPEHLSQSFPPIPPLMHSAGMKAAPITSNVMADTPKRPPSAGVFHSPSSFGRMPQKSFSDPVTGMSVKTPNSVQSVVSKYIYNAVHL